VINDVIIIRPWDMEDGMMPCASGHIHILLQYLTDAFERTDGAVCHRIGYGVVGSTPAAFGPHKIILSFPKDHIGPFYIAFGCDLLKSNAIGKGDNTGEVGF
jgi:hypothetical protein